MSIYDKASLVLIPSGTKTSKVYSQKPTNGDGDFTFSRSTAATRVNASGNIEKETGNLLLQSNSFNTTWVKVNTTLTSGQAGYDGTNDAWLVDKSAASARIEQYVSASGVQTLSAYVKVGTLNWTRLNVDTDWAYYDLANGVVGTATGSNIIDHSIEDVGGGWYRCVLVVNRSITTARIYPADADNNSGGTSGSIYIQDAQLNQGLIAQEVITTTTTAIYGGITDNVPRLDYTDSSCPALLLEPQRTNLLAQSELFSGWSTIQNATITNNNLSSPEGVQNATKITDNATSGNHRVFQSVTTSATSHTFSIFLKKGTMTTAFLRFNSGSDIATANVDLDAGTITATAGSAVIEDFGNDWYRCSITGTAVAGTSYVYVYMKQLAGYSGSGQDMYLYGAQVEAGSYATSYIPTYGSAVTRNTEPNAVDKVDLVTDGFFSSTELTWFVDVDLYERDGGTTVAPRLISSSNSQVFIGFNTGAAGTFFSIRHKDGTTALNTSSISFDENGQRIKVLVKISGTTGKAFINGTSVGTFTTLAASNYDVFDNTQNNPYNINKLLLFPTALTDQEAIDLTTI